MFSGLSFFRGFFAAVPILIGIIAGYCLSIAFGIVDFASVVNASWFELPSFTTPTFNLTAILMILPVGFVVLAEHVGHLIVTGNIIDRDLMQKPGLHRSLLGDGISNILSGFFGATPNTTYGENIGVMAMTKVFSVYVTGVAALVVGVSGASVSLLGVEMKGMVLASVLAAICGVTFSATKVPFD